MGRTRTYVRCPAIANPNKLNESADCAGMVPGSTGSERASNPLMHGRDEGVRAAHKHTIRGRYTHPAHSLIHISIHSANTRTAIYDRARVRHRGRKGGKDAGLNEIYRCNLRHPPRTRSPDSGRTTTTETTIDMVGRGRPDSVSLSLASCVARGT